MGTKLTIVLDDDDEAKLDDLSVGNKSETIRKLIRKAYAEKHKPDPPPRPTMRIEPKKVSA